MNEYLNARSEWNERYGSYIAAARRWRAVAWMALALAFVTTGGVVVLATQSRVVPYVVEVDGRQRPVAIFKAEEMRAGTPRFIRAELARFVQDFRGVSYDAAVQREAVERVYAHLAAGSPATSAVSSWYRANDPFDRASRETTVVEVSQVLNVSGDVWRMEWTERPRSRAGTQGEPVSWTGTAKVERGDIREELLILNPIGLFVSEFDWSRDLRERSE